MTLLLDQPPISHDTVAAIVADTCAGLFGEFSEQPIPDSIGESGMDAEAMVSITGAWAGHVRIGCTQAAGVAVAAKLLLVEPTELSPEDVRDALGEFVNIVGGNIKSALPGPSALSLPLVALDKPASRLPGRAETTRVELRWHSEPLIVSVWSEQHNSNKNRERNENSGGGRQPGDASDRDSHAAPSRLRRR